VAKFKGDKTFFHGKNESTGVLLLNLGTPSEPTPSAVRKYLGEFLGDSRVVEIPRLAWLPILHGLILPKRSAASAANYEKIWLDSGDKSGSPLLYYGERQATLLQHEMEARFRGPVHIQLAMRYGKPDIKSSLEKLQEKGARRILVLPLYPQYSSTTTATSYDAVSKVLKDWRLIPEMRFVNQYHDNPGYIKALAASVRDHWHHLDESGEQRSEKLLMSFHGLPKRNLDAGDPYFCQCHKTGRLLAEALELKNDQWLLTFQSRFGKQEWLQPYTDATLKQLAKDGTKRIDIISPGFPADCLETLEEINMENRAYFMQAGGEAYHYIPALNDTPLHIRALADIIQQHTQGWPETSDNWSANDIEKQHELTQQRAKIKGADF
jgi:ferrochelatase